jgi:hypothetical protein
MLAALLPVLTPILGDLLKRAFPDPLERERQQAAILAQLQAADSAQLEVNKVEAASASVFVAGWRPFIGWTCGMGLGWTFVGAPLLAYLLTLYSPGTPLPVIPTDNLMELVLAMLGLGGLRTFEKIRKAAK